MGQGCVQHSRKFTSQEVGGLKENVRNCFENLLECRTCALWARQSELTGGRMERATAPTGHLPHWCPATHPVTSRGRHAVPLLSVPERSRPHALTVTHPERRPSFQQALSSVTALNFLGNKSKAKPTLYKFFPTETRTFLKIAKVPGQFFLSNRVLH